MSRIRGRWKRRVDRVWRAKNTRLWRAKQGACRCADPPNTRRWLARGPVDPTRNRRRDNGKRRRCGCRLRSVRRSHGVNRHHRCPHSRLGRCSPRCVSIGCLRALPDRSIRRNKGKWRYEGWLVHSVRVLKNGKGDVEKRAGYREGNRVDVRSQLVLMDKTKRKRPLRRVTPPIPWRNSRLLPK